MSILPQEGAQGAACPGPGGGRARQARHLRTTRTTPRHTCGRSRPRGEVTRAGSQGRGNGAARTLRPPGKGSSHGVGFLGKLKAERAHGPAVPLVGVYPKEPRPGPSAPRVPRGSGTVPDVRAPSTDEDDARGVPVDLAFAAVYLLLPTRQELGASRLKKQRLVSPRKTRFVLHCRTTFVSARPGCFLPRVMKTPLSPRCNCLPSG